MSVQQAEAVLAGMMEDRLDADGRMVDTVRLIGDDGVLAALLPAGALLSAEAAVPARLVVDARPVATRDGLEAHAEGLAGGVRTVPSFLLGFYDRRLLDELDTHGRLNVVDALRDVLAARMDEALLVHDVVPGGGGVTAVIWVAHSWWDTEVRS